MNTIAVIEDAIVVNRHTIPIATGRQLTDSERQSHWSRSGLNNDRVGTDGHGAALR
jgi:hypothetical protein